MTENEKLVYEIHLKYSKRDENNKVHCKECPYGDSEHNRCKVRKLLEKIEKEIENETTA